MTEIKKTSIETMLNGEKLIIHKLKAGKYYEAQKIYVGMIDTIRKQGKFELKPQKSKKDVKDLTPDDVIATSKIDVSGLYSIFPKEIAKLVAFCIDIEVEKLLEDAYPEEITDIAGKVIELNNFAENLKNSVAPLGNLGAPKS